MSVSIFFCVCFTHHEDSYTYQMSTFLPYSFPLTISGAIQWKVPLWDWRLLLPPICVWMKEIKNLLSNGPWEGKHLNFKPKCLSRRESRRAGLAKLFQTMPLPLCSRPMTPSQASPQVKLKHSFGRSEWGLQGIICNIWNRWIACKQTSFPPRFKYLDWLMKIGCLWLYVKAKIDPKLL